MCFTKTVFLKHLVYKMENIFYSVMKSIGSFCGDVISGSFNKTSRDKDYILYQIYMYKGKYVRIVIMMIFILHNIIRKCILTQQ